jgi:selenide,water dikinase
MGGVRQVLTTDHLRAFTGDPWLLARIAAVHAMGDVWAMGATPQAALATVVLPRLSDAMAEAWLAEIMAAAAAVFAEAGAEIVGGHSSTGSELTVGFTVTGLAPDAPITVAGARPGDALILTKPIGTGTVLAGEMALQADGRDVAATLEAMARPQGDAAAVLAGAHAMTDVTGFGLAGHLMAICEASGVAAEIELEQVPILPGAEALAAAGVRSTLFEQNRQVAARMTLPAGPRAALLFDPQTAGGLLAAVPGAQAKALVAELRALGHAAAHIGRVTQGAPAITVI